MTRFILLFVGALFVLIMGFAIYWGFLLFLMAIKYIAIAAIVAWLIWLLTKSKK